VRNVQAFAARRRNILMPNLKLTLACWDYDRTRPLIDGRVKPAGIDLEVEVLRPRQTFQRMLDNKEFEVSELSLASYTALKGRGECPFVAVPVALSKIFRHSCIYVRTGAGIHTPQDLKGKRVGTSQWSSTGLVFMRGMLQHDYGVKPQDMHWFMGGLNSFVEPPLIALNLPNEIRLDFLSGSQTLEQMFAAGELDALLSLYIPKLFLARSPGATPARVRPEQCTGGPLCGSVGGVNGRPARLNPPGTAQGAPHRPPRRRRSPLAGQQQHDVYHHQPMAATNKCLAQNNKSRHVSRATKDTNGHR
jgi:hypothetical protein